MKDRSRLRPFIGPCEDRLPWYPIHPADLEGDPQYRLASLAQRGALFSLWNLQWSSPDGTVPNDPASIARLLGINQSEAAEVLSFVKRYFVDDGPGQMADIRLAQLRSEAVDLSRKRRDAAAKRWHPETSSRASVDANAMQVQMQLECDADADADAVSHQVRA